MTNEEILKKAIEKAESNGWQAPVLDKQILVIHRGAGKHTALENWTRGLVTSHDFCKAFWGEETMGLHDCVDAQACCVGGCPIWQYHLQQMVISEDPIKYLEEYL